MVKLLLFSKRGLIQAGVILCSPPITMGNFLQLTINFTMFCSLISALTCEDGIFFTSNVFGERIADGSIPSSISYLSLIHI